MSSARSYSPQRLAFGRAGWVVTGPGSSSKTSLGLVVLVNLGYSHEYSQLNISTLCYQAGA